MNVRTKALLAAAALTMMGATTAAPVMAKDKADKDAPKGPVITAAVRTAVLEGDKAVKASDLTAADAQVAAATAAAKTDFDRYWVEQLKLEVAEARKDNAAMAASLDALIANPTSTDAQKKEFYWSRGIVASDMKQPQAAITFFRQARQLGLTNDPAVPLRLAGLLFDSGDVAGGAQEMETAVSIQKAAGKPVPEDWYKFTVGKLQKANALPATWEWARRWIAAYPTPENWRWMLANYSATGIKTLPAAQQDAASLDLFRLMRATGALANYGDYLNYADLAMRGALGAETVALIQEGRSKGMIPASDADANRYYASATTRVKNDGPVAALDRDARTAKDGKLANLAANIYLATGNPAKAAELYKLAAEKGGLDAGILTLNLGIAQAQAGDTAGATATFNTLTGGPLGDLAKFWLLKINPQG